MLRKPPDCRLSRAIIEGVIAYAREANLRMAVAVVDHAGNVVSADRMDGASLQNIRFAEGKAFASALYRQTREWRRTSGKHENPRSSFRADIVSPATRRRSADKTGPLDARSRPPCALYISRSHKRGRG
jgi:Haem degrading protein HbpS-like